MPCARPAPTLRLVLDTCVLKLARCRTRRTRRPSSGNFAGGDIFKSSAARTRWGEYHRVLAAHPALLEEIQGEMELCFPLFTATAIKHEPDNRFLEVALAVQADYLITVNTARGHFDREVYERVRVATPGEFLNQKAVQAVVANLG